MVELVPRSAVVAREDGDLVARPERLPPVLAGTSTPAVEERVNTFLSSIAEILETWVARRKSPHTQRAYRQDVMAFVGWMGFEWPRQAVELLTVSVADVQAFRDSLVKNQAAPKTVNRRLCSLASFYRYVRESAVELRLPVNVPNPAHAQFIPRESSDPVEETKALSISTARHLMALVVGDDLVALRDRAMVKLFLYSGVRIGTVVRLKVEDLHQEEDVATLRVDEKGGRRRTIGLHFAAAQAVAEYVAGAGLVKGPLFRQRLGSRSRKLGDGGLTTRAVYAILDGYLRQLPGAVQVFEGKDGVARSRCVYTPHSLRATVATVLLDAGLDIRKVQELLGHRMVTTTQVYDKRRRGPKESASHEIPY